MDGGVKPYSCLYELQWLTIILLSMMIMIRYMYAGKIDNLNTRSPRLLEAADKYQLSELKEICEVRC